MNRSRSESTIKGAAAFGSANGGPKPKPPISFLQPQKEEKNVLLDSVRERLEKLRESQRKKDLEDKFKHDQRLLKELLLEEEIQTLISRKIKEAVLIEESQSLHSKQSSCISRSGVRSVGYSRGGASRGGESKTNIPALSHTTSEIEIRTEDEVSPHRNMHAAHTYPSSASRLHSEDHLDDVPTYGSRQHTPERQARMETDAGADDNSDLNSDLNSIGSAGSLGSMTRRPALIIIKKKDINGRKILETVRQKLPSPEKLEGDPQYPTAAFTASLLLKQQLQQQKNAQQQQLQQLQQLPVLAPGPHSQDTQLGTSHSETNALLSPAGAGHQQGSHTTSVKNNIPSSKQQVKLAPVVESSSSKSEKDGSGKEALGASGKWNLIRPIAQRGGIDLLQSEDSFNTPDVAPSEDVTAPLGRAPFLKARSSSGILNRGLSDRAMAIPAVAPKSKVVGEVVRGLSVSHLRNAVSRRSVQRSSIRSSQQFTLQSIGMHLDELQSEDILSTRFGGWTPPPISSSSKHASTTNFY
jgi:hypothetical protein